MRAGSGLKENYLTSLLFPCFAQVSQVAACLQVPVTVRVVAWGVRDQALDCNSLPCYYY